MRLGGETSAARPPGSAGPGQQPGGRVSRGRRRYSQARFTEQQREPGRELGSAVTAGEARRGETEGPWAQHSLWRHVCGSGFLPNFVITCPMGEWSRNSPRLRVPSAPLPARSVPVHPRPHRVSARDGGPIGIPNVVHRGVRTASQAPNLCLRCE